MRGGGAEEGGGEMRAAEGQPEGDWCDPVSSNGVGSEAWRLDLGSQVKETRAIVTLEQPINCSRSPWEFQHLLWAVVKLLKKAKQPFTTEPWEKALKHGMSIGSTIKLCMVSIDNMDVS